MSDSEEVNSGDEQDGHGSNGNNAGDKECTHSTILPPLSSIVPADATDIGDDEALESPRRNR